MGKSDDDLLTRLENQRRADRERDMTDDDLTAAWMLGFEAGCSDRSPNTQEVAGSGTAIDTLREAGMLPDATAEVYSEGFWGAGYPTVDLIRDVDAALEALATQNVKLRAARDVWMRVAKVQEERAGRAEAALLKTDEQLKERIRLLENVLRRLTDCGSCTVEEQERACGSCRSYVVDAVSVMETKLEQAEALQHEYYENAIMQCDWNAKTWLQMGGEMSARTAAEVERDRVIERYEALDDTLTMVEEVNEQLTKDVAEWERTAKILAQENRQLKAELEKYNIPWPLGG